MIEANTKADEQRRVTITTTQIKQRLATINQQLANAANETQDIEQRYGDNTKINITEVDDRMETNAAVQQQKQLVAAAVENEKLLTSQQQRLTDLADSPYFGRIDITEDGESESLYIGTATFMNEDDEFLVYDWRAPIASIYYNGTLGPVAYETPMGPMTVDLTLKRQFKIKAGQIEHLFDTNETVGDELLQAVLGQQSDEYMQNIVATIQKDQNDIIRDTTADLLIVQGVAGSGKTSAVLQRIAYLLYHSRDQLEADQMVLFSPNRLFSHYISEVLPSLGEKNMRQVTMAEFLSHRFAGLQVENLFNRFEKDQTNFPELTQAMRRFKESADFMQAIQAYVKQVSNQPLAFNDLYFEDRPFFTKDQINAIYVALPHNMLPGDKFLATKSTLIQRLKRQINLEVQLDWVADRIDGLTNDAYRAIIGQHEFASGDDEQAFIAREIVKAHFDDLYTAIYNDYFLDIYTEYQQFLATVCPSEMPANVWQAMIDQVAQNNERHLVGLSDAAPILYLRDLLTDSGQNHGIQYLFIDEMQDYSIAQFIYIHHAFPNAKLTALGDYAQDIFTASYQNGHFIDQLTAAFPQLKLNQIQLTKSYRATAPITNFAKALLPPETALQAFSRDGRLPRVITTTNTDSHAALVQELFRLQQSHATIAILTKDQQTAHQLYASLTPDEQVTLIEDTTRSLPKGILILPLYLAKGLEFDAVVGYDVSAATFNQASDRDLLYTLITRAMHDITIVGIGQISPLISQLPATLYETPLPLLTS